MATVRSDASAKPTRVRDRAVAPRREGDPTLPGLEEIRGESRPLSEVAAVPFALTGGPLPKPPRRAQTTRLPQDAAALRPPGRPAADTSARTRRPLLDRLHATDAWGAMLPPDKSPEALQGWLYAQAPDHGREAWLARMTDAMTAGDWDRAYNIAVCARVLSLVRAHTRARTPEERDAIEALVRGKPAATLEER